MSPLALLWRQAFNAPSNALGWPHLQRLAERWLRRWGYALAGLVVGLGLMWLARPEVSDQHTLAVQAVSQLQQQLHQQSQQKLVAMPVAAPAQAPANVQAQSDPSVTEAQRLLSRLPTWTRQEQLWADWQQVLAAHGLRLQFLQPVPSSGVQVPNGALVSHAAAWRVLGRFDDWARVWAACADSGPVCALERISVVATDKPAEVQIDAVMRFWMRPAGTPGAGDVDGLDGTDEGVNRPSAGAAQAHWMTDALQDLPPSARSRLALFAPSQGAAELAAGLDPGEGAMPTTNTQGTSAAVASLAVLPDDPHQWPLSQVRLAGIWQQGGHRQAVLLADTHWAKVAVGQRVTLEGHRVVAITDEGVSLRVGNGPVLKLAWPRARQGAGAVSPSAGRSAVSSASPNQVSPSPHSTNGSQPR
jgi:hypothetical protein